MKHNKLIAGLAAAGSLFAMSAAHAFVPVVAAGLAAVTGAAIGTAAVNSHPPAVAVAPAPPVAVAPSDSTVVLGGPSTTITEVVPPPRDGYTWERGHYALQNGVSSWVPGHWVANDMVIYEH